MLRTEYRFIFEEETLAGPRAREVEVRGTTLLVALDACTGLSTTTASLKDQGNVCYNGDMLGICIILSDNLMLDFINLFRNRDV